MDHESLRRKPGKGCAILGVTVSLFGWITREIVGESITRLFFEYGQIGLAILARFFPWILVASVIIIWIVNHKLKENSLNDQPLIRLMELDDSLFSLLPPLVRMGGGSAALKNLLVELLRDATRVFGPDVNRAAILIARNDFLEPFAHYQMPQESLKRMKFYVGRPKPNRVCGVAGKVYKERTIRVVHLTPQGKKWIADDPDYHVFDKKRSHPPYRSFACVPLVIGDEQCLGVLTIDSMDPDIFDSLVIRDILLRIGQRIAASVLIHEALSATRATSGPGTNGPLARRDGT